MEVINEKVSFTKILAQPKHIDLKEYTSVIDISKLSCVK